MPAPELPDFQRALRLDESDLDAAELAECHGVICGLICRQTGDTASACLYHLAALRLLPDPGPAVQDLVMELHAATLHQMDDEEMGFGLWLPGDDEPLEERTIALAHWCSGFLAGLASAGQFDALSEEAREALDDLQQIGRAELSATDESGDDEVALFEIAEYVRIVVLMMREEFRGPGSEDRIH